MNLLQANVRLLQSSQLQLSLFQGCACLIQLGQRGLQRSMTRLTADDSCCHPV